MQILYLTLSAISGLVELGGVAIPIREGRSFLEALTVGLAYQFGAFIKDSIPLRRWTVTWLAVVGFGLAILSCYIPLFLIPAIFCLSISLQDLREIVKTTTSVPVTLKRIARVVGFASSGFCNRPALIVVSAIIPLAAFVLRHSPSASIKRTSGRLMRGRISTVMVFHQTQYFCYAYTVPFIFIRYFQLLDFRFAFAYALGWLSYTFAFLIFDKLHPKRSLMIGHILVAASLIIMFVYINNLTLVIIMSILSGLGGGTVYSIELLRLRWNEQNVDMNLWEDIGHLNGLAIALLLYVITGNPVATLLGGAGFALTVTITTQINNISPQKSANN